MLHSYVYCSYASTSCSFSDAFSELNSVASSQSVPFFDPDKALSALLETIKDDDQIVVDECLKTITNHMRASRFKDALVLHPVRDELTKCVSRELHKTIPSVLSGKAGEVNRTGYVLRNTSTPISLWSLFFRRRWPGLKAPSRSSGT